MSKSVPPRSQRQEQLQYLPSPRAAAQSDRAEWLEFPKENLLAVVITFAGGDDEPYPIG